MRVIKNFILVLVITISLIYIKQNFKIEKITTYNDVKFAESYIYEYYHINDLDNLLKDTNKEVLDIKIESDAVLKSEYLDKIKESKKTVNFNYYDDNNVLLYSIIIDGKKITKTFDFDISLSYVSDYKDKIDKLDTENYDLYIHFDYVNVPTNTKLKMNVEDVFSDTDLVNVYYYDDVKNELVSFKKNIMIDNNYIEFNLNKYTDYLLVNSSLEDNDEDADINISQESTSLITTILTVIIIGSILGVRLLKYIKKDNNNL